MPLPPTRERPATFVPVPGHAPTPPQGPKPGRSWKKLALFAALVLLTSLGTAAAGAYFVAQDRLNAFLTPDSEETRAAQKLLQAPLPGRPANILLLGSDHRKGTGADDKRSDTMVLVRLDPTSKTISMLSFPRDLYVNIPGFGHDRINEAYKQGGPKLAVQTVHDLTGLDVHFIVNVDFKGFRGIVDELGGVYIDVDRRYFNDNSGAGPDYATIDLQPGYQRLNGRDALDYSRYRHTDDDFHRMARQQYFLRAFNQQITKTDLARNIRGLFAVMDKYTDIATGGDGEIDLREAYDYIRLALTLQQQNVYQVHIEGEVGTSPAGASIVQASEQEMEATIGAFLNPDTNAQEQTANAVAGGKTAKGKLKPPADLLVEVRNGNGVSGSAQTVGQRLREAGYQVELSGNAANFEYARSQVLYRDSEHLQHARSIASSFTHAEVKQMPVAETSTAGIVVIVGQETENAGATIDSNRVPEKQKPRVVTDPGHGASEFAELQREAGMRVLYPATRESSSSFKFPIVAYKANGKPAYRIVAQTASGEYWGMQGMKWTDPPIVQSPTRTVTQNGRRYMLFFDGTKLHMVAWRWKGGLYWVTNTLLNEMSNETLMAIAQGARPVPSS